MPTARVDTARRWFEIAGWACFLACSWTWCIGMFLPVLLVRDYGTAGFIVFALPNVVGAAAMGWMLRAGRAEQLTEAHRHACLAFSAVTIGYHAIFLGWMVRTARGPTAAGSFAMPVAIVAIGAVLAWLLVPWPADPASTGGAIDRRDLRRRARTLAASPIVWAVSIACGLGLWGLGGLSVPLPAPAGGTTDAMFLAPACVLGFALCPYLDLTFYAARRQQDARASRWSFGLGFGVAFLAMILLTWLYAGMFLGWVVLDDPWARAAAWWCLLAHLSAQSFFTVTVHCRAASSGARRRTSPGRAPARIPGPVPLLVAIAAITLAMGPDTIPSGQPAPYELVYRIFLSCYGLLFPTYVWLCMIPTWRAPRPPTARQLVVWAGACAAAAGPLWLGFVDREERWIPLGVGVVLAARLAIPRGSPGRPDPPGPDAGDDADQPAPA